MGMTFVQFAESFGLVIESLVEGRWVRVKTADKPRRRNGAYKYMGDFGVCQNHATMTEVAIWRPDQTTVAVQRSASELRALRQADRQKRIAAMKSMQGYWNSLKSLRNGHPYLTNKGLSMQGCENLRTDGALLVVPMIRMNAVVSLQTISPEGDKKYRAGCSVKGATFVMTRKNSVVTCLTEGLATGLAVFQSLPQSTVVVCFDAGNMLQVASDMKLRGMAVVCADNDWQTAERTGTNTGLLKGRSAAESLRCGLAYPEGIQGSDWADYLLEMGDTARIKMTHEIMRRAKPVFA